MSYDTHLKNEKKQQNALADTDIAQYQKDNAALKEQINATLDAAAESQAGVYRQEIQQAPLDSRIQYDKNAMQEAVDRKKIAESLANMGMTDSGLSSSMQTALTVQKSRADNSVRVAEQQRIRAAESMIDQIFANNEQQKAQKGIEIDQDSAAYARARRESANTLATQTATSLHNAEVEAAAEATKAALDYQQKRASMAQSYINNGQDATEAWGQAYYAYPDTSTTEGLRYACYNQLKADGYGGKAANAMAAAYMNVLADKGTQQDAAAAMQEAMVTAFEQEIRSAGIDLYSDIGRRSGAISVSPNRIRNTAQVYTAAGLSADATAYAVGKGYFNAVVNGDDATANQVGQALAQNFSGIYLEIALSAAGLE